MTKKQFIALADAVKNIDVEDTFTESQLKCLADFCASQNDTASTAVAGLPTFAASVVRTAAR